MSVSSTHVNFDRARPAEPGLTSVIVVAADSGPALAECARRVLGSSAPVQLIVSDNASADGSIEQLGSRWNPDARLHIVHNGKNLGFGTGCNRAATHAAGDMLLLLNPDCLLETDTITRLREIALREKNCGLLGASIVDAAGIAEPASRRHDPLFRRALLSLSGLSRLQSRWPTLAGSEMPARSAAQISPDEEVENISGALMLMPRAVFDRLGGFDEAYFLHCEDLDLCRRVRGIDLRVICANGIRVVHGKGGSSRHRAFFVAWHKHRSMWRWFRKFDPAARNPLLYGLVWLGLAAHYILLSPRYAWSNLRASRRSQFN